MEWRSVPASRSWRIAGSHSARLKGESPRVKCPALEASLGDWLDAANPSPPICIVRVFAAGLVPCLTAIAFKKSLKKAAKIASLGVGFDRATRSATSEAGHSAERVPCIEQVRSHTGVHFQEHGFRNFGHGRLCLVAFLKKPAVVREGLGGEFLLGAREVERILDVTIERPGATRLVERPSLVNRKEKQPAHGVKFVRRAFEFPVAGWVRLCDAHELEKGCAEVALQAVLQAI